MLFVPLAAQERASVGQKVPDVTFPDFLNGDGRQKLSDFRGQPVVIDKWGTRCPPCIGTAVPNAIRHDHEHASDGLVTILVESQGADAAQHEAFLWKTFPDNQCFACTGIDVPIPESRGIPYCAVIGVDGTLLWVGNPAATPKPVEEFVAAELAKVKKGWGDTAEARKVRAALYGKNDLAAAAAVLALMADGDAKTQLQQEIDARYAVLKGAIAAQQERGCWLRAQAQAKALQKAVGAHATWAAEVASLVATFDSDDAKAELAMDKKLEKVEKLLRERKDEPAVKALKGLLAAGNNSKVGARAGRTLAALALPRQD